MSAKPQAMGQVSVVDVGVGMAAALAAKHFADLGARVARIEPEGGDPFYDFYPAYRFWRQDETPESAERAEALLAGADICILGGEDYPGLASPWRAEDLSRRFPHLIVLRLAGYPDAASAARPAVDLLAQARTGIVHEQFSTRPNLAAFPMPSVGAAIQGVIGALVALLEREQSGRGQIVVSSLAGGAAMFWGAYWMQAEKADAGFLGITPRDVRHLTFQCAGGEYLQLTMGVPGARAKLYAVLGIPDDSDPTDRGMPSAERGPERFFGDVPLLNAYTQKRQRGELLDALREAGIPAEAVLAPGENWDDEQVRINSMIRTDAAGWSSVAGPLRFIDAGAVTRGAVKRAPGQKRGPLSGVKILDCGIYVAGPYASKLLADYGAEVVMIESPRGRSTLSGERTIICATHGKRSICVDLKSEQGRRVLTALCADADIVHHNFKPGVADRLGLDSRSLRAVNPDLITLETTAYGPVGPKAGRPGFDMIMQAHCGLQMRAGGVGNPPLCSRTPLIDFAAGALGAIALLAALYERGKAGRVLSAETNLLNTGLHMMSELVRAPDGTFQGAPLLDSGQTGIHPAEALYQTKDGWVAIAARSDAMAAALARLLDLSGLDLSGLDPGGLGERRAWSEDARRRIGARVRAWRTADLLEAFDKAGVWAEECVSDAWARGAREGGVMRIMQDDFYGEVLHCIGPLVSLSRSKTAPAARLSAAPGADTREILREIGVDKDAIGALFAAGVVAQANDKQ